MRTTQEIQARIAKQQSSMGLFDFGLSELVDVLDFADARVHLIATATAADWQADSREPDAVRARLIDYLPFAFEKAEDERGLSAMRSLQRMGAWLWLLGDDELLAFAEADENYAPYGLPVLRRVAEKYAPEIAKTHA